MPLIPLELPAGVYRNGTDFQSKNRWIDSNLVRWRSGTIQPINGWQAWSDTAMTSIPRAVHAWKSNDQSEYVVFGCYDKLWYYNEAGVRTDITPVGFTAGNPDGASSSGWGSGLYGTSFYGVQRANNTIIPATTWSLDNWGEYLVGCSNDDGKLYEWPLTGVAAQITNSPTDCTGLAVTDERFLFALGASGNPRLVAWSDREDNQTWTPDATNEAGDLELQTTGVIRCGIRARGQLLILTSVDAHAATYIGPPYVYGIERVGSSCGIVSANAAVSIDSGVLWFGQEGFYIYANGAVSALGCEVWDYIYRDLNRIQVSKIWAVSNGKNGEVWWFYPSASSKEIDRYVVYNYLENTWYLGQLSRSCGADSGAKRNPIYVDATSYLPYEHELGYQYGGTTPYAESGPISIGSGDQVMVCTNMIPDELSQGQVTATFKTRFHPNDTEREYGPYTMSNPTSVRFTGRQVRMRIEGQTNEDWRLGVNRLEAVGGGRR